MPTPKRDEELLRKTIKAYFDANGVKDYAARALKVNDSTYRNRLRDAVRKLGHEFGLTEEQVFSGTLAPPPTKTARSFDMPELPARRRPVAELVEERKRKTSQVIEASKARELVRVRVKQRGPIGLACIGDPHVDDDGCDIGALERDLKTIAANDAMHAVHVGDLTNNWIGRLTRLYAHQSTSADEALALAEWMFELCDPLVVVGGNHDGWRAELGRLIEWLMKHRDGYSQAHGARIAFEFPSGFQYRMHVRHDFPGHSQFNVTHGMRRETLFGYRDHLLVAGHKHVDGVSIVPLNTEGIVSTQVRVSGYKVVDDFADGKRYLPERMAPTVLAVVNPDARKAAEVTKLFWDLEDGSDYLTWLRSRKAA